MHDFIIKKAYLAFLPLHNLVCYCIGIDDRYAEHALSYVCTYIYACINVQVCVCVCVCVCVAYVSVCGVGEGGGDTIRNRSKK